MPRGGKRTRVVAMLGLVVLMVPLLLLGCTPGTSERAATGDGASGGGATSAAVDASGAYRSGIAFEVPPFHGIEPSLRLTYDSSNGNGVAGVGWSLAGVSTIRRAAPGRGVPWYQPTDVFLLDGMELVACTATMTSPSCRYKASPGDQAHATKIESYQRIAFSPDRLGGGRVGRWHVWSKTGTLFTYEPRAGGGGRGAPVAAWDLAEVRDTSGNHVDYHYWTDTATPGAGERYLDSVAYGEVTVKLRYGTRPDPATYGTGTDLVAARYRLLSVEVRVGQQTARAYQLDYAASSSTGRSLLRRVRQFGTDAAVCADTTSATCAYGTVATGTALPPTELGTPSLTAGAGTWQGGTTTLAAGAGAQIGPPWPGQPYDSRPYQEQTNWIQPSSTSREPRFRIADVNGDGRDDVLALRYFKDSTGLVHQVLSTALATRTGYTLHDFEPDPTNVDETVGVHEDFLTADADGDGMADVMQITNDLPETAENEKHLQVWRSNGDGTYIRTADQETTWPWTPTVASCFSFGAGIGLSFGIFSIGASWNIYTACDVELEERYVAADVNGDGRADLVGASHNTADNTVTLHTALSIPTGSGFDIKPDIKTSTWHWSDTNTKRNRFFPADIDGDGRADLVQIAYHPANRAGDSVTSAHAAVDVALSRGDGTYTFTGEHIGSAWDDEDVWYPGDVNGDARTDLIHIFRKPPDRTTATDHGGFQVGLSDGSGGMFRWVTGDTPFPWYRPSGSLTKYPSPWLVGDVNGDHRADIVSVSDVTANGVRSQDLAVVFAGPDDTFTTDPAYLRDVQPGGWNWETPEQVPAHLGDLNGDGKADLVFTPWRAPGFKYPLELLGHLSPNRGLDMDGWHPADVDGNGRQDLVYAYYRNPGYTIYTLLQQGNGSYQRVEDGVDFVNTPGALADLNTPDTTGWLAADVGGGPGKAADGRADLVDVDHVADQRLTVYSLLSDGNGRFRHKAQAWPLTQGAEWPTGREARRWLTADVNGDGRTDLVNAYNEGGEARIHLLTSTGDGGWSWTRYGFFLGLVPGDGPSWQAADVNGDGRADLVMAALQGGKTTVRTLLSNGDASWTPVTDAPVTLAGADAPSFVDTRRWLELEANGDGLADLGYVEPVAQGARVHTLTSIGNGHWKAESSPTLPVPSDYNVSDAVAFRRLDVNGDGRTDLLHLSAYLNQSGTLDTAAVLLTNRSPGWSVQPQRDIPFHAPDAVNWRPMDRDGDGRSDLAYLQPDLQTLRLPVAADLVDRVVSPLGGESQIAYQPSSAFDASQVNGQANGPAGGNCHLPLGMVRDAVASVTVSDGRSSAPSKVTYAYACAGWSDAERGFLGWGQVYEFRPGTTAQPAGTVLNQYELTHQCLVQPVYQQLHDASGKAFDKTITAYLPPGSAPPYRCLVNYANHVLLNQWVAAPNDYTYYTYDEFGNVTSVLEQGDPQVTGDDRYTSRSYHPATGPYVVGLPSGEQLHEGADSSGKVLRARMYCYDGDTSLTCTATPTKGLLSARKELNLQGLADLAVTTFAYDATGNLAGVKDPNGNVSTLFYDPSHTYPTMACNALQQCGESTWDRVKGRVTDIVDPSGLHTILGYDVFGRLTSVAPPSGGLYTRQYLDDGKPATQRVREQLADGTPDGLWREVLLDGLGRPYREVRKGATPGARFARDTSYVGASMLPATRSEWHGVTRPPHRGVFERFGYDPAGRLATQTHPDGAALRWEYGANSDNDWVKAIDELGHERRTYTDAHGRTVRVAEWVDGKPADVAYGWSAADELRTVTDPDGHVTAFAYDNRGRRTGVDDPDRGKWSWAYDLAGNQLTQTDARKLTVTFTYDALNRVKTKADPDGRLRTWRYDEPGHPNGLGRLTSVTDSFETACPGNEAGWFGYDATGHATTVRQCVAGTTLELGSGYDSLGRQKSLTYPDGETVTYEYDLAGRLWRMPGYVDAMAYDAAGRLTAAGYANGTHAIWDVDARRGWLNKATVTGPAGTLYQATYQHLANGAVSSTRSPTSNMNLDYGYDELNRLTSVGGDVTQTFHYNPSGDIIQNSALGIYAYPTPPANGCGVQAPHLCPHAVTSIAGPGGSESFKYDDDGNLTHASRVDANGTIKTRSIEWNADGKPTVIEDYDGVATQLRYDAFGTRTYRERDGQATVFFGNLVDRSWPTAGGTVKTTKHYFAGPLRVASADAGGTSWHTTDALGSPRARTGPQGALIDRTDYQPFGNLLGAAAGGPPGEIGFTGARTDTANGLVDLNARWYDPHLGRFISADPVLPMSARPQALNPYAYAENNPVSLTDPSGTQACAPAQETCLAVAEPPAPTMRFEPMTIEGHWVAPEDRVHVGCQSCTLLGTAAEASATQALRPPTEPVGGMGTVAATQPPLSVPPLTAPDTSATAVVVITHDYGIGSHAALWVNSSRGPLLFDPGGSFQEDTRGSGASFEDEDADLEAYVAFQEGTGSQVSTYRFAISQQDASEIVDRIAPSDLSNGIGGSPGFCSISVCRALTGVGPFKDLSIHALPGGLERELRSIQGEPSLGEQVLHWIQVFGLKSNPLFVPRF